MELLAHLLNADAATPRLTVYDESTGARMDFSAQTLDNWVAKIANMLEEELDLEPDSTIVIDVPTSWQAAVIALGSLAAGTTFEFGESTALADVVFTSPARYLAAQERQPQADIVLISDDPFGRGIIESGGDLPTGAIDFGPTVRFYGDQYFGETQPLPEVIAPPETAERLLSTGWSDKTSFTRAVLEPLAAGGSAVVVAGLYPASRLDEIAANEKVTARL
ncbi:TIGR03089 family protein [Corynebacterium macginleyi]|uniref:TIGR03089 family protein n=1 Tax=Corynebacterium macginleyi TaxID=38290 RepID=UPI00190CD271|nr:TIGR03089 family protein [Corynebacterium macginleyi]MBK4138899.1 TIGR03089 family protein [Corynebacterium macginleyi]MBK4149343.1 TIGR03089 family protein [Corynebacterium macginleyi]MBK4158421.1 TIGR03089 family protein [Corynebacterium macginleyi]MBK4179323.1 TIGR03089 family protein [Corynebacterium macginleyi]